MFIGNIVNIVQHSHLYNSFLLIIVACIVILPVAILYRDHVGFCVIVTFSSIHKLKWPVLLMEPPFNLKKNILIPNVAEKNILILVEEKKII